MPVRVGNSITQIALNVVGLNQLAYRGFAFLGNVPKPFGVIKPKHFFQLVLFAPLPTAQLPAIAPRSAPANAVGV